MPAHPECPLTRNAHSPGMLARAAPSHGVAIQRPDADGREGWNRPMPTPTRQAVPRARDTAIILQLLTDRLVWRMVVSRQHMYDAQRTIDEAERLLDWLQRTARRPRLYLVPDSNETEKAPAAPESNSRSRRRNRRPSRP